MAQDFLAVANTTVRDSIALIDRTAGLECWTETEQKLWKLNAGLTNSDWQDITSGLTPYKVISVADLMSLSALDSSSLVDGVLAYVTSVDDYFKLDSTSALTNDGITIVSATAGKWLRAFIKSTKWANQSAWYIDSVSGSDENNGFTSGTALRSWAEMVRRISLFPYITQTVDVYLLNDLPSTDFMVLRPTIDQNGVFHVHGTLTSVGTGNYTGVTSRSAASNTPVQVTDTGRTWTSNVTQMIKNTAGTSASIGAWAWVTKDLGSNAARLSSLCKTDIMGTTINTLTEVNPTVGDTYTLYTMTNVFMADIVCLTPPQFAANKSKIVIENIRFNGTSLYTTRFQSDRGLLYVSGCSFAMSTNLDAVRLVNCFCETAGKFQVFGTRGSSGTLFMAGASLNTVGLFGEALMQSGFLMQGGFSMTLGGATTNVVVQDAGMFDWSGSGTFYGILMTQGATLSFSTPGVAGKLWGTSTGTSAYPLFIESGKVYCVDSSKLTATGPGSVTQDFRVNNMAVLPPFDMAATPPVYKNSIPCTWANLQLPVASGGFGGSAVHPNGNGIVQEN